MNTPTNEQIEAALNYADSEETTGGIKTRMALRDLAAAYREQQREIAEIKQQRDNMAEALRECLEDSREFVAEREWWQHEPRRNYQADYAELLHRVQKAEQALAALKGEA